MTTAGFQRGTWRIPGTAVRALVERGAEKVLRVLNTVNDTGKIPAKWKIARVVLIPKRGRDPTLTSSFRPISVLPALSKVWEYTFKNLIEESLGLDPFHDDQYGFRRRVSTVDALRWVMDLADWSKRRNRICVLAAVDVKNAFNTLSWSKIFEEAKSRRIPRNHPWESSLEQKDYSKDDKRNCKEECVRGCPSGIYTWTTAQGSGVRRSTKGVEDFSTFAFADDLAVILDVAKQEEVENKWSMTVGVIVGWCADKGLKITQEKTEVILLTGKRMAKIIEMNVEGHLLTTKQDTVRYLGMILDKKKTWKRYIQNKSWQMKSKLKRF